MHPKAKRERGRAYYSMLFWIIAVPSVACALAIVWGIYLVGRRWL